MYDNALLRIFNVKSQVDQAGHDGFLNWGKHTFYGSGAILIYRDCLLSIFASAPFLCEGNLVHNYENASMSLRLPLPIQERAMSGMLDQYAECLENWASNR